MGRRKIEIQPITVRSSASITSIVTCPSSSTVQLYFPGLLRLLQLYLARAQPFGHLFKGSFISFLRYFWDSKGLAFHFYYPSALFSLFLRGFWRLLAQERAVQKGLRARRSVFSRRRGDNLR